MNDLVSVIITTYKGVENVGRAIESVLKQTYDNIEIIVVDDNGIGTKEQCETENVIKKFNERVIYIPHKVNMNGSVARNTGIKAASGRFIALLDDDDAFRPEKIEKQVNKLLEKIKENEQYAICYTGMCIHFENGKTREKTNDLEGDIFSKIILRKIEAPSSVLLFTKEAALKVDGFDGTFRRHQDWEFLDRLSSKFYVTAVTDICMDRYILKRNSAKDVVQFEKNRLYYLDKMQPYIQLLSKQEKDELYYIHHKSIFRECLKEKKIGKMLYYLEKCGHPFRLTKDILHDTIVYLKR